MRALTEIAADIAVRAEEAGHSAFVSGSMQAALALLVEFSEVVALRLAELARPELEADQGAPPAPAPEPPGVPADAAQA